MNVLIILLILLGLPLIVYFFIKAVQMLVNRANLNSKSGILITTIIVFACLYLTYVSKGIFIGFLIFIFLPFILIVLGFSKGAISSGGENISPSTIKSITNIIPIPILILSHALLMFICFWMLKEENKISEKILILFILIGALISATQFIKKQKSG
jgi:hypothetical protein